MLKVLIADDEAVICRMIEKLVDWEKKELKVIGIAHNGFEVIDRMKSDSPDIIITDIRMPGCDGLQLVQKGIDMGLAADFIIISGYKNFEYAHTALNLGVKHYLLKPIDKKELNETIDRILDEHKGTKDLEQKTQELTEKVVMEKIKMRKHFLTTIIEKNNLGSEKETQEMVVKSGCEFENGCFVAFLTKLDSEIPIPDMKSLLNIMYYQIEKNINGNLCEYMISYVKSGVVTVLNFTLDNKTAIAEMIEKIFNLCRQELDKFEGYHVTLGVGGQKGSIANIQDSILEAVDAVKCRLRKGTDRVIWYDTLKYQKSTNDDMCSKAKQIALENESESLDSEAFLYDFGKLYERIKENVFCSPIQVFELIEQVTKWVEKIWRQNQISEELVCEFDQKIQFVLDCNFKEELLILNFRETIKNYFERVKNDKINTSQLPIRLAKQYINQNYMRQITLEEVAGAIHLSPAYLSTLFKKEMEIKFSDYLTFCRMDEAKRLLKSSDLPINLIAENIGYTDSKYFSKTFNKVVGLKPSEYRKLYQ